MIFLNNSYIHLGSIIHYTTRYYHPLQPSLIRLDVKGKVRGFFGDTSPTKNHHHVFREFRKPAGNPAPECNSYQHLRRCWWWLLGIKCFWTHKKNQRPCVGPQGFGGWTCLFSYHKNCESVSLVIFLIHTDFGGWHLPKKIWNIQKCTHRKGPFFLSTHPNAKKNNNISCAHRLGKKIISARFGGFCQRNPKHLNKTTERRTISPGYTGGYPPWNWQQKAPKNGWLED